MSLDWWYRKMEASTLLENISGEGVPIYISIYICTIKSAFTLSWTCENTPRTRKNTKHNNTGYLKNKSFGNAHIYIYVTCTIKWKNNSHLCMCKWKIRVKHQKHAREPIPSQLAGCCQQTREIRAYLCRNVLSSFTFCFYKSFYLACSPHWRQIIEFTRLPERHPYLLLSVCCYGIGIRTKQLYPLIKITMLALLKYVQIYTYIPKYIFREEVLLLC